MIDYDKLRTDRSYRAGVKDAFEQISSAYDIEAKLQIIHLIQLEELDIQKQKIKSLQQESEDMEGTPVSC